MSDGIPCNTCGIARAPEDTGGRLHLWFPHPAGFRAAIEALGRVGVPFFESDGDATQLVAEVPPGALTTTVAAVNEAAKNVDAMVEKAARTADPDESIRLYREAEKRATDATTRLPLYFYTKSTLIKPYVKGYFPNGQNRHPIRWMWIDPSWKTDHDNRPTYPPEELPPPGIIAP